MVEAVERGKAALEGMVDVVHEVPSESVQGEEESVEPTSQYKRLNMGLVWGLLEADVPQRL